MRMYVFLAVIVVFVGGLAYVLARARRAVRVGRRRRAVGVRLDAVVRRAEEAHRQRTEAADTGAALTALLPAIKQDRDGPRRVA